jgi:hypothetical protein
MDKPWWDEETWRADDLDVLGTHEHCDDFPVAEVQGTSMGLERAKLAAAAPEMARMLVELEWSGSEQVHQCASCFAYKHEGHADNCRLVAVLRKAGVVA